MANYGNSFGNKVTAPVSVERIPVWDAINERFLGGAWLKVSVEVPEGTVIPAGTPIATDKAGGEAVLNGTAPIGLTEEDVVMGTEGCSFTIVTRGVLYESRVKSTITTTQKGKLGGITFTKE